MRRAILIGAGNPFSAAFIRGWLAAGNEIAEIWYQPAGALARSQRTATRWAPNWSVRSLAQRHGIPSRDTPKLKDWAQGAMERAEALRADLLVTCMTMQIVPAALIEHFPRGAVNFHPARLPHYRGPSPFLGMLLDGAEAEQSAMTLHELSPGIDEGPIIAQRTVPADDAGRHYQQWMIAHAAAIEELARTDLPAFLAGELKSLPQSAGSYRRIGAEAMLGRHATLEQAARAIDRAGGSGRIAAITPRGTRPVKGRLHRLGPPTSMPPRLGPLSVELDLADARVRVARWTALDTGLAKIEMIRAMHAADRQAQE